MDEPHRQIGDVAGIGGVGQDQRELVAAEPRHQICLAQLRGEPEMLDV